MDLVFFVDLALLMDLVLFLDLGLFMDMVLFVDLCALDGSGALP